MSEQHYHASTYTAQSSIGYLIKRAHAMMMDVLENLFADRGFSFIHYAILTWVRDGIAVNPKDICVQYRHDSGALTRVIDQLEERGLIERVRRGTTGAKWNCSSPLAGRKTVESLIPLVVDKLNVALADFSREEAHGVQAPAPQAQHAAGRRRSIQGVGRSDAASPGRRRGGVRPTCDSKFSCCSAPPFSPGA